MSDEEFMKLVEQGLSALPEHIRSQMNNVAVVIDDEIRPEKKDGMGFGDNHAVFGLYEGVPQTERGVSYQALPDKITIYKRPILEAYTEEQDIKECIENTIWHEVAHHFGFGEEWIAREEERRGKKK